MCQCCNSGLLFSYHSHCVKKKKVGSIFKKTGSQRKYTGPAQTFLLLVTVTVQSSH